MAKLVVKANGDFLIGEIKLPSNMIMLGAMRTKPKVVYAVKMNLPFEVETADGTQEGNAGDYLVKEDGKLKAVSAQDFHEQVDAPAGF